jgi:hypothetical protein
MPIHPTCPPVVFSGEHKYTQSCDMKNICHEFPRLEARNARHVSRIALPIVQGHSVQQYSLGCYCANNWGREIRKNGSPEPIFRTDEDRTFFLVEFPIHPVFAEALKTTPDVTMEVTMDVTMEVKRLLNIMTGEHSHRELQKMLGLKNADHFRKAYLLSAIEAGVVEMTLPDKPKSGLQRYRLTEKGRELQKHLESEKKLEPHNTRKTLSGKTISS